MTRHTLGFLIAFALLAPLGAVAQSHVYVDRSIAQQTPFAKRALLMPPDVSISEISAGGVVEKVPDWSKQGRAHVVSALRTIAPTTKLDLVELPALSPSEQELVDQHIALYVLVALNVRNNGLTGGKVWTERLASGITDYTIGPGLVFLAAKTGADAMLFTLVDDFIATAERKALMVLGAILGGVVIPLGRTFAVTGLLELKTGRLLWQSYETSGTPDMRDAADAHSVLTNLFKSFPRAEAK